MKKLLLTTIIVILVCMAAIGVCAETVASGECGIDGDDLTWTFDDSGTLTVSGVGKMCSFSRAPWKNQAITSVVIEEGVTVVASNSFSNCSKLERVVLPSTLISIESSAFYSCSALTEITLPSSLASICKSAFAGCSSLKSITIPSSVQVIENSALPHDIEEIHYDGTAEEYMDVTFGVFPERVIIDYSLYIDGALVENFTVPEGAEVINRYAFFGCTSLKSINIPSSVEKIDISAFEQSALESVTIAEGVKTIGDRAFAACNSLKEITLPESVETVQYYAFLSDNLEKFTVLSKDVELWEEEIIPLGATIVCYRDSTAYDYAIEYGYKYEIINDDGSVTAPVKLATPQNLSFIDENGNFTGVCCFDAVENANKYEFKLYSGDFVILKSTANGRYVGSAVSPSGSNRRGFNFRYFVNEIDFESGEYYFTVQAKSTSNDYSNSEIAVSDVFYYTRPEEKLSAPQNITWSAGGDLTFDVVENAVAYALDFFVVKDGEYDNRFTTWIYPKENVSSLTQRMDYLDKKLIESYMDENGLDSVDIAYSVSALSYDLCEYLDSDVVYSETFTYKKPVLLGDIDGDNEITVLDTLASLNAVLNKNTANAPDMNEDGVISLIDVLRILKEAVK